MRIYVAGASAELEMVRGYMRKLEAAGHVITHDWTQVIADVGQANGVDLETARTASADDLNGIDDAHVFWLLAPPKGRGWGAGVELGYALHILRHSTEFTISIVVSGDIDSIFASWAGHRFATHDEALAHLRSRPPATSFMTRARFDELCDGTLDGFQAREALDEIARLRGWK